MDDPQIDAYQTMSTTDLERLYDEMTRNLSFEEEAIARSNAPIPKSAFKLAAAQAVWKILQDRRRVPSFSLK